MLKQLKELFFVPWNIVLVGFLALCAFSGSGFYNNLDVTAQYFALYPFSLQIIVLILLDVGLFFVCVYLLLHTAKKAIQNFSKSAMGLTCIQYFKHLSTRTKWSVGLPIVVLGVLVINLMVHAWVIPPLVENAALQRQTIKGTPILFEMRVPIPTAEIVKEKRQEAAFIKGVQAKDAPPPPIFRYQTKTINGRADVKQTGPDTYQIKMLKMRNTE
jgi:hypothetical protein